MKTPNMFYKVVHGAGLIQLAFGCMMIGLGSQAASAIKNTTNTQDNTTQNNTQECNSAQVVASIFYFLGALLLFITGMMALTWKKNL
ncbi:MAG: hypothetical protein K0U52_12815 [Gammaproteobacteria bacterium]|nr:hypothetical protein [Gammaproteobacteria bacterium]